ncbi:enoyl-CoA hydratase/isomerase family protein [Micromonospora purpureochromogenes]|uniref:enoyl-CoA hydratase/isomerase family protein n=1 Tax=Micromonospora purpureochromogenes TaxID=47872 RepID=UPI003637683E
MSQIRVRKHTARYWTATFDNEPVNLMNPATVYELDELLTSLETDPDVRVVVFDSANPDFFIAHWDVTTPRDVVAGMKTEGATQRGMHPYVDVQTRLGRLPVVTIAAIRGRVRGAGSEFALACDIRFASRERAVFGQFEIGVGAVPGGGSTAHLPRLMGRGRALEALLGGGDFPAELAERYGWINRALPDAELDTFVDSFARRIVGYDKEVIVDIKELVNRASLPPDEEWLAATQAYLVSTARPGAGRSRMATLLENGMQQDSEVERNLGHHVARYDDNAD